MRRSLLLVAVAACGPTLEVELEPTGLLKVSRYDAGHDAGAPLVPDAGDDGGADAGPCDAGFDAGDPPELDAGDPPPADAGQPELDAGTDAGSQIADAGLPVDAGTPPVDAGTHDGGHAPLPGYQGGVCVYDGGAWGCIEQASDPSVPIICDVQDGVCTNCGYAGGPCCDDGSGTVAGHTCNNSAAACLHHSGTNWTCHANFACSPSGVGTGEYGKLCFEGGCCGGLTCGGTCT